MNKEFIRVRSIILSHQLCGPQCLQVFGGGGVGGGSGGEEPMAKHGGTRHRVTPTMTQTQTHAETQAKVNTDGAGEFRQENDPGREVLADAITNIFSPFPTPPKIFARVLGSSWLILSFSDPP